MVTKNSVEIKLSPFYLFIFNNLMQKLESKMHFNQWSPPRVVVLCQLNSLNVVNFSYNNMNSFRLSGYFRI